MKVLLWLRRMWLLSLTALLYAWAFLQAPQRALQALHRNNFV